MKRTLAAALVALSLVAAAPAVAKAPRVERCRKVVVHMDDGTQRTIRVCFDKR